MPIKISGMTHKCECGHEMKDISFNSEGKEKEKVTCEKCGKVIFDYKKF